MFNLLTNGQENLLVLLSAFIIGGVFKTKSLFIPVFAMLTEKINSKRLGLFLISLISGILPIEGRVTVSAPILDSLVRKDNTCCSGKHRRGKLGILDYVASHHYYLWSPLEKSVIVLMAGLGMSYGQVLSYTVFPLIVYIIFLSFIVFKYIDEKDIDLTEAIDIPWNYFHLVSIAPFVLGIILSVFYPPSYIFPAVAFIYIVGHRVSFKEMLSFIRWKILFFIALLIILANIVKSNDTEIIRFLQVNTASGEVSFLAATLLILGGGAASFILGSSGKYASICVILTLLLGIEYFPIIFMVEYAAYLLSPTHKCLAISVAYFDTNPKEFYKYVGLLALLMLLTGLFQFL